MLQAERPEEVRGALVALAGLGGVDRRPLPQHARHLGHARIDHHRAPPAARDHPHQQPARVADERPAGLEDDRRGAGPQGRARRAEVLREARGRRPPSAQVEPLDAAHALGRLAQPPGRVGEAPDRHRVLHRHAVDRRPGGRQRAELVGAQVDVQPGQRQARPREDRRGRRRHPGRDAEAVAALPVGWDEPQAHAGPRAGVGGEAGDLAHLLRPVRDDRGPLRERPAELRRGLEGAVEDDLRPRDPRPAGDAVLEARGHLGPASRPVQARDQAHQGVGLDRVGDGRLRPGHRLERAGLGLDAGAVEDVERGAEALGQLPGPAWRAGVERADHATARAVRRGHTRRPTRVTSSRCG